MPRSLFDLAWAQTGGLVQVVGHSVREVEVANASRQRQQMRHLIGSRQEEALWSGARKMKNLPFVLLRNEGCVVVKGCLGSWR